MTTILVVDDEQHIREVIEFALKQNGFQIIHAKDGREALDAVDRESPDLIVLDILMPEISGTDVCREIRKNSNVPIVFLSSKDEELDKILGLELGGDDYLTKPFSPRELVARIKAVLRRITPEQSANNAQLQHGNLQMDIERHQVRWNKQLITLTVTEFGMLRTLLSRPGHVFSRDTLMDNGYELHKVVSDRTIDSHIRRLRRKFQTFDINIVETVHGVGYKLGQCE
ncbi:MAG: response regulator transcription factor [Gammaproteobacteria bacterium]|nr:response regulator transcription factor [Gammaproteobacteria bacterium]